MEQKGIKVAIPIIDDNAIRSLKEDWNKRLAADSKYWLENDAKIRAITEAKNYEEFCDIVKTAHLRPISRKEFIEIRSKKERKEYFDIGNTTDQISHPQFPVNEIPDVKNSTEFVFLWNKLDKSGRRILLQKINMDELQTLLQADAPPGMLGDLTEIIEYKLEKKAWMLKLLQSMVSSKRFALNVLFLKEEELKFYSDILDAMDDGVEVIQLREKFGLIK